MSTLRTPVGPQPPSVYWKRRAVVLLGLVAVIVIIVLIVVRPGSGAAPAASPSPSSTAGSTPGATTSGSPAAVGECAASAISLEAKTDKQGYQKGEQPLVSMVITNTGTTDCSFDVGTAAQEYRITSGSDQIWSSKDCQTDPASTIVTLAAGVPQETTPFPWDRTRSSTTTCDGSRPAVIAKGASYHLTVYLGELASTSTQFLLY